MLSTDRLQKVRVRGSDILSACPACREDGKDRKGDHLRVFASGAYHCIAHPQDRMHNRRIFELAGVPDSEGGALSPRALRSRESHRVPRGGSKTSTSISPLSRFLGSRSRLGETAPPHPSTQSFTDEPPTLQQTARNHRNALITRWQWDEADVWEDSPQRIDQPLVELDPRHFLATLYPEDAVLWTGETHESGQDGRHASRWRSCREWQAAPSSTRIGPMISPAIWNLGETSRAAGNVLSAPYTVLDFDGFDGITPTTEEELRLHLHASLAIIRWLRERLHWQLAAILHTGNKSLHAWFHAPDAEACASLVEAAPALGLDAGLIGRAEHPCRLPGQLHAKSGNLSRVLWLATL